MCFSYAKTFARAALIVLVGGVVLPPASGLAQSTVIGKSVGPSAARRGNTAVADRVAGLRMIELLLTACRDVECKDVSLLYDPYEMSLMNCMFVAQQEAAAWTAYNPGWTITRLACRMHEPPGRSA